MSDPAIKVIDVLIPGPQGPAGLTYLGVWNAETAYKKSEVVTFGLSTWVAKQPVPAGTAPVSGAHWGLVAGGNDVEASLRAAGDAASVEAALLAISQRSVRYDEDQTLDDDKQTRALKNLGLAKSLRTIPVIYPNDYAGLTHTAQLQAILADRAGKLIKLGGDWQLGNSRFDVVADKTIIDAHGASLFFSGDTPEPAFRARGAEVKLFGLRIIHPDLSIAPVPGTQYNSGIWLLGDGTVAWDCKVSGRFYLSLVVGDPENYASGISTDDALVEDCDLDGAEDRGIYAYLGAYGATFRNITVDGWRQTAAGRIRKTFYCGNINRSSPNAKLSALVIDGFKGIGHTAHGLGLFGNDIFASNIHLEDGAQASVGLIGGSTHSPTGTRQKNISISNARSIGGNLAFQFYQIDGLGLDDIQWRDAAIGGMQIQACDDFTISMVRASLGTGGGNGLAIYDDPSWAVHGFAANRGSTNGRLHDVSIVDYGMGRVPLRISGAGTSNILCDLMRLTGAQYSVHALAETDRIRIESGDLRSLSAAPLLLGTNSSLASGVWV